MQNKYFLCFIFVVAQAYENILSTKISRFTVDIPNQDSLKQEYFTVLATGVVQCSLRHIYIYF